jgi:hypothetical protein
MRRGLRAVAVGSLAAAVAFVLAAIALAIVGIAQSGHGGRAWTDADALTRPPFALSVADVVALAAAAAAGVAAAAISVRR